MFLLFGVKPVLIFPLCFPGSSDYVYPLPISRCRGLRQNGLSTSYSPPNAGQALVDFTSGRFSPLKDLLFYLTFTCCGSSLKQWKISGLLPQAAKNTEQNRTWWSKN